MYLFSKPAKKYHIMKICGNADDGFRPAVEDIERIGSLSPIELT